MKLGRREFVATGIGAGAFALLAKARAASGGAAMYGLIGSITAVDGKRDELVEILLEGINDMPGCLSYIVAKDPGDANTVWITEVWESKESHTASLKLPSVQTSIARGKPLIAKFGSYTDTEPVGGLGIKGRRPRK